MTEIITIDFEASCLPRHGRSFPIEVGIADLAGRTRSWLIRPHASWQGWSWTEEAEALHGLSRMEIERSGRPAAVVLEELWAAVGDATVVADSSLDALWLETLAAAAVSGPAPFSIIHVSTLCDEWRATSRAIADAMAAADRLATQRHRAAPDAYWLALVLTGLSPSNRSAVERVASRISGCVPAIADAMA